MARKLSAREYTLLGVLAVAALTVLWFRDDNRLFGGSAEEERLPLPSGEAPLVNMGHLVAEAEPFDPDGRNLFLYYTPPPPKVKAPPRPKVDPAAAERARRQAQLRRAPQPTQDRPTAALRPPVVQFKYLGFLGPKDQKLAVFEKGEDLTLAAVGDVLEEQFRLVSFKYEGVVIGYTDDRFKDQTTELQMSR